MRFLMLSSLIGLLLSLQQGCSNVPLSYCAVTDADSEEKLAAYDIHDTQYAICQEHTCRIDYHHSYSKNRYMVVEGEIGDCGKKYPVVLDTGASQPIFLNVRHVLDNKLTIYHCEDNSFDLNGHTLGLCHLPELRIGDISFIDITCLFLEPRAPFNLFGVPIATGAASNNIVIMGLPSLLEFKYIVFDNINQQAEFSCDEQFKPQQTDCWEQYPLFIEEDFHGNTFLFVKITIAEQQIVLQLDTGSGRGLAIGNSLWEHIGANIPDVKLKKGKDFYPYIGRLPCKRAVIPELKVGSRTVRGAEISVFPDDSPLLTECEGMIGMQYLQDTTVVLDFERTLMWIKRDGAFSNTGRYQR